MSRKRGDWLAMEGHYELEVDQRVSRTAENRQKLTETARNVSAKAAHSSFISQLGRELWVVFFGSWMNVLLLAIPFAFAADSSNWGTGVAFILAMLALCPLAERLGYITEQLAMYTNDSIGGLLNASFGNATELIMAAFALRHNLLRVVQLTLLGSVVSNLLLVLGTSFFIGGVQRNVQRFNQQGINVNCGLLLLACIAVGLPSMLSETGTARGEGANAQERSEVKLSRFESCFMLCCYGLYLLFQLITHRHLFEMSSEDGEAGLGKASSEESDAFGLPQSNPLNEGFGARGAANHAEMELSSSSGPLPLQRGASKGPRGTAESAPSIQDLEAALVAGGSKSSPDLPGGSDGGEEKELSWVGCLVWLSATTVLIALLSEVIMDNITHAAKGLHVPLPFLVTIVLPIVGNAAEHMGAVYFAWRNRIEISLGIAVGSATQIAVFVMPLCVVLAWMMGKPLDLNLNTFESGALWISTLLTIVCVQDGLANWMKGMLLMLTFVFVSGGFWWHADPTLSAANV